MRITVLGGGGLFGRHLVPLLKEVGNEVTVASRSSGTKVNIETGEGLAEAVEDADVVVHSASDARKAAKVDIGGTRNLLDVLEHQHLYYISIVGVDRHPFAYYRAKLEAEQMIESSGIRYTILRATQFHDFVTYFLGAATKPIIAFVPKKFVFQPVDTAEVAGEMATLIHERRTGMQPDFAGPAVHDATYLARSLMEAKGKERPMLNLPVPGKAAQAFKEGLHTNPDQSVGTKTWETFLDENFKSSV